MLQIRRRLVFSSIPNNWVQLNPNPISPKMLMNSQRHKPFLYLKFITSPISHRFCTNASDSNSFAASYLIHNLGFSPQLASKLCSQHHVRFKTPQNPNSVLTFLTNQGFSNSQLHNMIAKAPWLLSCDPHKRVSPKLDFFLSKGISSSDIVNVISKHPCILSPSLENFLVPSYELLYRFLQSDKEILELLKVDSSLFCDSRLACNIRMLIENGIPDSNIARMLRIRSLALRTNKGRMLKAVEELKDLGFDPSKSTFVIAMLAKTQLSKTGWNAKIDMFKKWGWSDEDVVNAFRKYPHCMLSSVDKMNSVMSFWVNDLGWDARDLVKGPNIFSLSLEESIKPRARVVQFLIEKGLMKKKASLTGPFRMPEKLFIVKYINHFKEHSSDLLKLMEKN